MNRIKRDIVIVVGGGAATAAPFNKRFALFPLCVQNFQQE